MSRNNLLAETYWRAVLELGYALPDERPADEPLDERIAS
jgi:hypothetical protein